VTALVAALFVSRKGPYWGRPDIDAWDEGRDARGYTGPLPIVAHPPCQLWTNFAALNYKRWGGEHNRPGNDGGCFDHAIQWVQILGGVLEHPAFSHAWKEFDLMAPKVEVVGWQQMSLTEWVCEVWQSAYGHKARKRTWLYYHGFVAPKELDWTRNPGTHQCGWFDRKKPTLGKREASLTPPAFADSLISLAKNCRKTIE
jgi:hypothetical protein